MGRLPVAHLRALTLDVTNTLLRPRCPLGHQYADAALRHGIRADPAVLDKLVDEVISQKSREMPNYGRHYGVIPEDWWRDVVRRVFRGAGYTNLSTDTHAAVFSTIWDHFLKKPQDAWEVLPNVYEGLDLLKSRGLRLSVVSNFDRTLFPTLDAFSLTRYFDQVVTSDGTCSSKPQKAIFHAALRSFGGGPLAPGDVAHVGDDLQKDYLGPLRLGMTAFLMDSESHLSAEVMRHVLDRRHVVRDLKDVNRLVALK